MTKEQQIEQALITRLEDLKYTYRPDIRDRETLEQNFREKFQALNKGLGKNRSPQFCNWFDCDKP